MKNKNDTPLRKKCDCGNTVKNHHLLSDECWGRRERRRAFIKKRKSGTHTAWKNPKFVEERE